MVISSNQDMMQNKNDDFDISSIHSITNGIFSHSKAEAILQRIIETVEKHQVEIKALKSSQTVTSTQYKDEIGTLTTKVQQLEEKVNNLTSKVDFLEKSISIPGSTTSMTVGESILSNKRTIARTLNLLSNKVDAVEIKELDASIQERIDKIIPKMERDFCSNGTIEKVNDAISSLESRVDVIANDVQNKVDKSLFKTISSEANSIRNYTEFIKQTESSIGNLDSMLQDVNTKILVQNDISDNLISRASNLETFMEESTNIPSNLVQIQSKIDTLCKSIDFKADKEYVNSLIQENNEKTHKLECCEDNIKTIFAAHETLAKHFTKRLSHVHSKEQIDRLLSRYMEKEAFDDAIGKVNSSLGSKGSLAVVQQLMQRIESLQDQLSITQRKADLSVQFVEWYGKRT